jgi:hypothetical protein
MQTAMLLHRTTGADPTDAARKTDSGLLGARSY